MDSPPKNFSKNRPNSEFLGLLRAVALVAAVAGAVGSVGLMFRASQHPPRVLLVLFTIWVLAPFVALLWANIVSKRWSAATRATLHCTTLIVMLASLAIYGGLVDVKPAGSPNAFLWVVVPGASFMLMTMVISTLGFIRLFRRRAGA